MLKNFKNNPNSGKQNGKIWYDQATEEAALREVEKLGETGAAIGSGGIVHRVEPLTATLLAQPAI